MKRNVKCLLLLVLLSLSLLLTGCEFSDSISGFIDDIFGDKQNNESPISLDDIPEFDGKTPYVVINNNVPFFDGEDTSRAYEIYSPLDSLGRCGVAIACIGAELMPTEDRESISSVKPSGWQSVSYNGTYLYNRCHLIGFQLTGENANELNLITGTRFMNVDGMLPFENMVADYVKETEGYVLYRVTPIFDGDNLVARGVLMEAKSVGDDEISFCVYVYNNQPGITIDYATGESRLSDDTSGDNSEGDGNTSETEEETYVLNTSSKKFHKPSCSGAQNINPENREEVERSRDELINEGYSPCGICNP